ncbi:uncharacterized protein LOC116847524 isoform X2 [Odontomachus brunneus]|nr:uncharacterized protein LOC116847524 isoform X2 [Odontomachus brunneus]XP_032678509.1 uncharacterized protein LOC116847524 isoform X2 [Odontomachus brunneus]XP_032678510.1 uncharacterized protein LOC116847524 isoform X2 [Odontomachus brunneus]
MCNRCYMISYCSEEHEAIHRNSHSQICKAIRSVITYESFWDTYPNSEIWIETRKGILHQIRSCLSRDIHQYEIEMIFCAKSCYVCYRQANIKPCNICYAANFCDDDQLLFKIFHEKYCRELLLLLNMNIFHINGCTEKILFEDKYKFTKFSCVKSFHDTFTFINKYVGINEVPYLDLDPSELVFYWSLDQRIYSDYVSGPLTLYYALQESNLIPLPENAHKYIIHVIGANKIDIICLKIWHIFLHCIRQTKNLYIVFINSLNFESSDFGFVCSNCKRYKQKLYIKSVSEPYHDFVHLDSYEKPNVIILFEIECLSIEEWFDSVEAIIAQQCPLLLTANSENTVQENVNKIEIKTGINRNRIYRENKFRSYMPRRNDGTGEFYYRNLHFIMYS